MPLDLKRFFLQEGPHLNFFQAAYLLERIYDGMGRPGTGDDLKTEGIRFETVNNLAFPSSDIAAILPPLSFSGQAEANASGKEAASPDPDELPDLDKLPAAGRGPLRMQLTFMGLYGVSSPLPAYFVDPITLRKTEYFELKKFLDIFTHRFYSLFFRSWKKYRHYSQFDPALPDKYTLRLLALTGQWPREQAPTHQWPSVTRQGPTNPREQAPTNQWPSVTPQGPTNPRQQAPTHQWPSIARPDPTNPRQPGSARPGPSMETRTPPGTLAYPDSPGFDLRRIPFARFLGSRVRSAKGLQQLLRGYFGFPGVRIHEFASEWVDIPVLTRLGIPGTELGVSSRLGERMEDRLSRFVVEIGPLHRSWFNQFMPSQASLLGPFRAMPEPGRPEGRAPQEGEPMAAGDLLAKVKELIDVYLRDPLDYKVKIILDPEPDKIPLLGSDHTRLGMGSWLGTRPAGEIACRL